MAGFGLLGVAVDLLLGQRARQVLVAVGEAEVEAEGGAAGQRVADGAVGAPPDLLGVLAEALQLGVAQADVEIEGP